MSEQIEFSEQEMPESRALKIDDDGDILSEEFEDEFQDEIDQETINLLDKSEKLEEEKIKHIQKDDVEKKKTKKIKKPVDSLVDICKKFFSSLIARNGKYAIFNLDYVDSNTVVIVSNRPKLTFEDYLLQYTPGDLSINIITFKKQYINILKERLKIPEGVTIINLTSLRKSINAASKIKDADSLQISFATRENGDMYQKYVDISKTPPLEYIERYGFVYTDWRTLCILKNLVTNMMTPKKDSCVVKHSVTYENISDKIFQNLLVYPIFTKEFIKNNERVFPEYSDIHKTNLIFIDGKDIISLKEYVKKLKTEYRLEIMAVVPLPDKHISYISIFEDEDVKVISSRPYTSTFTFINSIEEVSHESV